MLYIQQWGDIMVDFKLTQAEADALNQECLADKMRLLGRTITGVYDNALRPLGIRASQMNISSRPRRSMS